MFSIIYVDSVTTSELNGLYSVKSVLSLELSRQELGANIECRVETPALENIVSNNINIDLQGLVIYNSLWSESLIIQTQFIFPVRPTKVDLSGVKDHTVQGSNILLQCLVSFPFPLLFSMFHHTIIINAKSI